VGLDYAPVRGSGPMSYRIRSIRAVDYGCKATA